jgi:hypothetical protein
MDDSTPMTVGECERRHEKDDANRSALESKVTQIHEALVGNVNGTIPGIRQELNEHKNNIRSLEKNVTELKNAVGGFGTQLERIELETHGIKRTVKEACEKTGTPNHKTEKVRLVLFAGSGATLGTALVMLFNAMMKFFTH